MKWLLLFFLGCFTLAAQAGETAYTVRATELKAKPFSDAATLASLAERSKVEVLARQASWMQVQANGKTGWVKMLSLRFGDAAAQKKSGDSGLAALFNVAKGGGSGSTVATGVRGLSEENLKNPHPDPQALQQLKGYKVNRQAAQQFARAGKLKAEQVAYLPAR
ncbi:MAG: hypothetical protein GC139_00325 [Sideroxydans sp.]|nr:hypothetical protein [Sideroxydans sp.]